MSAKKAILFYDGDCALCNHSVQFIIAHEKKSNNPLLFCSLQTDFAKDALSKHQYNFTEINTLVLLKDDVVYYKSTAALNACSYLKIPYRWLTIFKVIPRFVRDGCYDFIAVRRKKIVKQNFCYVPTADLKGRFLD